MGLGAPKRRNKLSHDPNNTAWSRSTTNFGHRILSQQGWEPGQYLGAENANHSDHYTAANASHIRILLREDNLGLGAKVGGNKAETFGLSLFSGVLGRLNGKSDDQVQKQQDALRDAELRQYQVGKYGFMNFVSGGLLVGDRIEKKGEKSVQPLGDHKLPDDCVEKKCKKRKVDEGHLDDAGAKRSKKEHKMVEADEVERNDVTPRSISGDEEETNRSRRKDNKKAKRADDDEPSETARAEKKSKKRRKTATDNDDLVAAATADEKARLKQEKRARKEDRRKRKDAKRLRREAKQAKQNATSTREVEPAAQSQSHSAPAVNGGRHAVRHRYIMQKRMAGMDAQAMKEIFMIKSAA